MPKPNGKAVRHDMVGACKAEQFKYAWKWLLSVYLKTIMENKAATTTTTTTTKVKFAMAPIHGFRGVHAH